MLESKGIEGEGIERNFYIYINTYIYIDKKYICTDIYIIIFIYKY